LAVAWRTVDAWLSMVNFCGKKEGKERRKMTKQKKEETWMSSAASAAMEALLEVESKLLQTEAAVRLARDHRDRALVALRALLAHSRLRSRRSAALSLLVAHEHRRFLFEVEPGIRGLVAGNEGLAARARGLADELAVLLDEAMDDDDDDDHHHHHNNNNSNTDPHHGHGREHELELQMRVLRGEGMCPSMVALGLLGEISGAREEVREARKARKSLAWAE
jgi:hypothetical protein